MVRVGNAGDKGVAQFTDMLFTVADILPGCILVEVNMAGNIPGDVGFWNTHFRIGGAAGSKVQKQCGGDPCKAAFMLMHLTASSSAYIENMWGWTADHDLDGGNGQTIATGRGILVEATAATWLHGTAFEHNTLYQYSFRNARNVFVGMQQSETPYWQGNGSPKLAPQPWEAQSEYGDPDFANCGPEDAQCRMAWYNHIDSSSGLYIYGSGFWTFFNDNSQACGSVCQQNANNVLKSSNIYWFNLNTKANVNLIKIDGKTRATQNDNPGSWGGCVAAFMIEGGATEASTNVSSAYH
ncbi:MAG: hypothetical protein M1833_000691 [Piccolia ochrophora]|nr:MAG: hypothetical protein M1833_000691 [Piccolia ochrophora]